VHQQFGEKSVKSEDPEGTLTDNPKEKERTKSWGTKKEEKMKIPSFDLDALSNMVKGGGGNPEETKKFSEGFFFREIPSEGQNDKMISY